jgi:hypothetical protein
MTDKVLVNPRALHYLASSLKSQWAVLDQIARDAGVDLDLGLLEQDQAERRAATSSRTQPRKRQ